MAFLAHSIPWHTVSSMIEVINRKSHGIRFPELAIREADHRKQLEFFATQFQNVIREHSSIERKRFHSAQEYKDRAQKWRNLQEHHPAADTTSDPDVDNSEKIAWVQTLQEHNEELRQWISVRPECFSMTNRRVFPADFATTYMSYVPITSGGPYGRQGLVEEFASIEAWVDLVARRKKRYEETTEDERNRTWLDERSCSDIVRLLIIDSAMTDDLARRSHMIDNLFLLAHHPRVGIGIAHNNGMDCCNASVGLSSLFEKIASPFVYLNLLWSKIDSEASPSLLKVVEREGFNEGYSGRMPRFMRMAHCPAYMNLKTFGGLRARLLEEHGHFIEHVVFNPLFAPYVTGRRSGYLVTNLDPKDDLRKERDIFEDLPKLKEAIKGMWMILVYCDMIFTETGNQINWEYVIMRAIDEMFEGTQGHQCLLGMNWIDYEFSRYELSPDGVPDRFSFCLYS